MRVAVIGTGYVGLVTGACLADIGHEVVCMDIDASKIARLQAGKSPIYEPGLDALVQRGSSAGRLRFTDDLAAIGKPAVIFLALPTPPKGDGDADLSFVLQAARTAARQLTGYTVIITKSTVPVGTARKVHAAIAAETKQSFDVVSNPEFLREGVAIDDFMHPDRIVVGSSSEKARKVVRTLYKPFVDQGVPLLCMDEASAEMAKYASNAFLATKISFINEIANLCELVGARIDDVKQSIGLDPRIGSRFLNAGLGYGGSCFPKDVLALQQAGEHHGYSMGLLGAVIDANEQQKQRFVQRILQRLGKDLSGKTIALWGLAFKQDTDDIRQSPALYVATALLQAGAALRAYDPQAMDNARAALEGHDITFASDPLEALDGAGALIIATEWGVFGTLRPEDIAHRLATPVVIDGRNLFEPAAMRAAGLEYESIGRP